MSYHIAALDLFRNPLVSVDIRSDNKCFLFYFSQPLKAKAVLLKQNFMTSVLALRKKTWMVFFIGTGDGQLIKVG